MISLSQADSNMLFLLHMGQFQVNMPSILGFISMCKLENSNNRSFDESIGRS